MSAHGFLKTKQSKYNFYILPDHDVYDKTTYT